MVRRERGKDWLRWTTASHQYTHTSHLSGWARGARTEGEVMRKFPGFNVFDAYSFDWIFLMGFYYGLVILVVMLRGQRCIPCGADRWG